MKRQTFKFKPFSRKQRMTLNWWTEASPVKNYSGIIADGAIRSGKTISMSLSFVIWAMSTFSGQNFAMCGKTIGSFRRNVLFWLKLMLRSRGYSITDHTEILSFQLWRYPVFLQRMRQHRSWKQQRSKDHNRISLGDLSGCTGLWNDSRIILGLFPE